MTPKEAACCSKPIDKLLDAELFKALADSTRLTLLACLAKCGRGCSVSEIAECCSVDFSVVSRHLQTLERARLIAAARDGRSVRYKVRYSEFASLLRQLADAIDECAAGTTACCPAPAQTVPERSI
jgi:ArsR family transcriptional regulator